MYIIDCVPIKKIPRGQSQVLSYFYASPLPVGALVLGEMRRSYISMVVVSASPVSERKAQLKRQNFQLKPLRAILFSFPLISKDFISFLKFLADYFFVPLSYFIVFALPPARILESPSFRKAGIELSTFRHPELDARFDANKKIIKTLLWGMRYDYLFNRLKEVIYGRGNALVVVPDEAQLEYWSATLAQRGITPFIYTRAASIVSWKKIYEELPYAEGRVILGVSSALFAPISHIQLVAVILEESPAYYHDVAQPFFHVAAACEFFAKRVGAEYIGIALSLTLEQCHAMLRGALNVIENENIVSLAPKIVDARARGKNSRDILVPNAIQKLEEAMKTKEKAIVFVNRKGYSASVMCRDCGAHVQCSNCSVPYTFHTEPKRALVCHHCGKTIMPPEACPACHSYNLDYFGMGIQRIVEELKKKLPQARIIRFDRDARKGTRDEKAALQEFLENERAILVGSELMLKYVYELRVAFALLVHFDRIFGLPDYSIEEQARRQLVYLEAIAQELMIQSYTPEREYFSKLHDLRAICEEELHQREKLGYPPFTQLIRVVFRNKEYARLAADAKLFERVLKQAEIMHSPPFPCFIQKEKGQYCMEVVLRVSKPKTAGDMKRRNEILQYAPPGCEIYIDPMGVV